jgi:hypothetical protein
VARATAEKKLASERKKYEEAMATLGTGMQKAIVALLAPLIPEGWYLTWEQKDDCYDDENYYFGVEHKALNSELKPKRGKLLKEEETEKRTDYRGNEYEVTVAGAEYEWSLDETCKPRKKVEFWSEDDPGVIPLPIGNYDAPYFELIPHKDYAKLEDALDEIADQDFRRAFGDTATVVVRRDGSYEVK